MKKLIVGLLVGVMCFLGTTAALAYNEAPMLTALVDAGELPPLEQRLPEEPQVIEPLEKVGKYGGTLRSVGVGFYSEIEASRRPLVLLSYDTSKVVPCAAKGWDIADDYKSFTIYLRKGQKWSDGQPFTADDILFWFEDVILNDELSPTKDPKWFPGEEPMKVRKVDDYTVRFELSVPQPTLAMTLLSIETNNPKHYLKKYHINYNPDANELAKEEGFDNWWECFQFHSTYHGSSPEDINLPVLTPWVIKERDAAQNERWERNPYYWRVDTAGNQLPYIDEVEIMIVATPEIVELKIMSGEVDIDYQFLDFSNYVIYKENEDEGDYKVYLMPTMDSASALSYAFNYTHKDPVLRNIFNDIRFRQAASLAINREEISKILFFGKTPPWTAPVASNWTGFEDWMGTYYAAYAPERANELLDEMGLKWDKNHEYRLRPDGKTLSIVGSYCVVWLGAYPGEMGELIKEYWKKIGIKLTVEEQTWDLNNATLQANDHDMNFWNADGCAETQARANYPIRLMPPWHWTSIPMGGTEWRAWYDTKGEKGTVPPENVKRIFNLVDEWQATPRAEEKRYLEITKELLTLNVEGLYLVGTVAATPYPSIIKNSVRNVRREDAVMSWHGSGVWHFYHIDEFFFEE